jgi:site-specific DNA recombinase
MRDRARPKTLRCAIYTRKSSEEGLEQDFNSLHAQREACEAYISSQRHEGWTILAAHYDDGGYSGGSMERPALRRLLDDIAARQIDVVVVYKVDRLTRSLTDFAKIVEVFDAQEVSFVSVTQQFNTTSSMGRLTLNVLLSFAQFEREVTAERIRDKIAASKKKGLWMGGWVPIGYDRKDRTLIINKAEAEIVRTIFALYLKLQNVRLVEAELDRRKIRTKPYVATTGRVIGNRPFSRGHIYKILSCALYTGQIVHKGASHPGQHAPIIDREMWGAVQAQLGRNGRVHRTRTNVRSPSLLAGLLFQETGNKFTTAHARKNGKQYRYYVAVSANPGPVSGVRRPAVRLAAPEIETLVLNALKELLRQPKRLIDALQLSELAAGKLSRAAGRAAKLAATLESGSSANQCEVVKGTIQRIVFSDRSLRIELKRDALLSRMLDSQALDKDHISRREPALVEVTFAPMRRGVETRLVLDGEHNSSSIPNAALIKAIARGHSWFETLVREDVGSIRELAAAEGVSERFVAQQMQLAFLAPVFVDRILDAESFPAMTAKRLALNDLPLIWSDQIKLVGQWTKASDRSREFVTRPR